MTRHRSSFAAGSLLALTLLACGNSSNLGNAGGSSGAAASLGGAATSGGSAGSAAGASGSSAAGTAPGGSSSSGASGASGHGNSAGAPGAGSGGNGGSGGRAGSAGGAGLSGGGGSSGGAGGGSGASAALPFMLGADISSAQESTGKVFDTDGEEKSIFAVLKNHGFNYVRLRTFVDPNAAYGYSSTANACAGKPEAFGDKAHVIAYGKQAKQNGMGFLLDFHYSDTWADPGNQIIPAAWRSAANIDALAALAKQYTKDVLSSAIAQGARPDMVQVGNEITAGMLRHIPGPNTDCWGNEPAEAPFGGVASDAKWADLAKLLKAGIAAVREVDPTILVMLHIENTKDLAGVKWWVTNAQNQGVSFDVLGLSCYTKYQGAPSVWEATFANLATSYPNLKFAIAEYNPDRTAANNMMKALPNKRGLGTFFWEPTQGGDWGSPLFTWQDDGHHADPTAFAEFDTLRTSLGL